MTPPRHVVMYIPPGAGFTKANLKELGRIARWMKDAQGYGLNITEPRQASNAILRRIKANGGYPNVATMQKAMLPYLAKFRKLNAALTRGKNNNNRNLGQERQNKSYRRVQEAAGKFKALRNVAALRRPPSPGSRRMVSQHNVGMMASLMRPYMLAGSTPVTMTYNRFMAGPPRPRVPRTPKRKSPSPNRAATVTRSGRRSVKPRS